MTTAVRQTVPPSISVVALGVAGVICAPLMYIVYLALSADSSVWSRLWNTRIPELLFNTVSLAVSVSAGMFSNSKVTF